MYEESKEARGMTYTGLETYVQQAAFDQTLTRLYGAEGAEKAHSRCMEVMEEFPGAVSGISHDRGGSPRA